MIKKIPLPRPSRDDFHDGQMNGFMMALDMVYEHIRELKEIYLGQHEKVAVLERLERRIAEDTK